MGRSTKEILALIGLCILFLSPAVTKAQVKRDCLSIKDQLRQVNPAVYSIFNNLGELDGIESDADSMHIGYNSYKSAVRSSERNIEGIQQNIAENRARGQSNPMYWRQIENDLRLERDRAQKAEQTHLASAIEYAEKINQRSARFADAVSQRMQSAITQSNTDNETMIAIVAQSSNILPKLITRCLASRLENPLRDEQVLAPLFKLMADLDTFARDGDDKVATIMATRIADVQDRSSLDAVRSGYLVGVYADLGARAPVLADALASAEKRIAVREADARRAQVAQQRSRWTSGRLQNSDIVDAVLSEAATVVVSGVREGERVTFGGGLGRAMGMSTGAEVRNTNCTPAKGGARCDYLLNYYMTYMGMRIPLTFDSSRTDTFVVEGGQLRSASLRAFLLALRDAGGSNPAVVASNADPQRSVCNSLAAGFLASGGNPSSSLQSSLKSNC